MSHASIVGFYGSRTGDTRSTGLRGAGTADTNASRTVRRCVPNRRANSRTDTSGSSRRVFRICSNKTTLDLLVMNPTVHDRKANPTDPHQDQPGGAKSGEHNPFKWGQNR